MPEPFSRSWCDSVNQGVAAGVAASAPEEAAAEAVVDSTSVQVLVRLRRPDDAEYRGLVTVTPRQQPFVHVEPYSANVKFDAEVEIPVQILQRVSGKSVVDCGRDPWIPAVVRVRKGMDKLLEMSYKHRYSSPIRQLSVPNLV